VVEEKRQVRLVTDSDMAEEQVEQKEEQEECRRVVMERREDEEEKPGSFALLRLCISYANNNIKINFGQSLQTLNPQQC